MKYKTLTISLFACALAPFSFKAAAQIPTTDVVVATQSAMQHALEIAEMVKQLEEMKRQYEQAQDQFDDLKEWNLGNSVLDYMLDNPELYTYIPSDTTSGSWREIYSSIGESELEQLREEYNMYSDNTTNQEMHDTQLTNLNTMEAAYRANNLRLENIEDLRSAAASAETPQEKQDVSNLLALEQAAISNEANRLAAAQKLMDQQEALLIQKKNAEFNATLSLTNKLRHYYVIHFRHTNRRCG